MIINFALVVYPSVRTFENLSKQNKFQVRIVIATWPDCGSGRVDHWWHSIFSCLLCFHQKNWWGISFELFRALTSRYSSFYFTVLIHSAGDHMFSVRTSPQFQNRSKQNKLLVKIVVVAIDGTMGLAEGIIEDTHVLYREMFSSKTSY